jgi:hypothetical protein
MERIHSLDVLKLIIACGVVWAHAMLMTNQGAELAYLFGQGLVRTVVPTFAVVSGFLFYFTLERGKAQVWLARLALFYLFWCAVYLPLWWPKPFAPVDLAENLFFGPMHLWYMAALMQALCLLMLVKKHAKTATSLRRWLLWTAVPLMLLSTTIQAFDYFSSLHLTVNAFRNGLFYEYPFAVFGYLVAEKVTRDGLSALPKARVLWLVLAGLAVLRLAEAWGMMRSFGVNMVAPPDFPLLLAAFAVTMLLVTLRTTLPKAPVNLSFISMMIYFLHVGFLVVALYLGYRDIWVLMALGLGMPVLAAMVVLWVVRGLSAWLPDRHLVRLLAHHFGPRSEGDRVSGRLDAKTEAGKAMLRESAAE